MNDQILRNAIKALNAYNRAEKRRIDFERFQREERLKSATTFTMTISRNNENGLEKFELEGYKNALKIFNLYRESGHMLNLSRIRLKVGKEVLHSVKFSYK